MVLVLPEHRIIACNAILQAYSGVGCAETINKEQKFRESTEYIITAGVNWILFWLICQSRNYGFA